MTPARSSYRAYSLVSLGLTGAMTGVLFAGTAYFDPNKTFRRTVAGMTTADYLANLREHTEFGCRSFLDKRPDILFVGDSHTYSGFRFKLLADSLGTSVSACALGGFYIESMPLVFDTMAPAGYFPKVLVLGASPREFAAGRDKESALATHRSYLSSTYSLRDFIQDAATGRLGTGRLGHQSVETDLTDAEETRVADREVSRIAGMKVADATAYMAEYPNKAAEGWRQWSATVRYTPDIHRKIDDLCATVRKHAASLYVIDIPESPYLRNVVYPDAIRDGYQNLLGYFSSCASTVIARPASFYGIDDRHFFNRFMRDDFPYDLVARGEKIPADPAGRDIDYDPDHMNLIGATLLTQGVVGLLHDLREGETTTATRNNAAALPISH